MTGGIFAVLDDIAILFDDIAVMSKVAAKKTAGILGDDLAVNAEKATGFSASREIPVIWAITKGSFINKLIILPMAFLLSAFASWLIVPVLLLGGGYLCYEGVEKVVHFFSHKKQDKPAAEHIQDRGDLLKIEKEKIKSAVRTDFILSIEIIVIALGTVVRESLTLQIIVVSLIALIATVGVYGLVALLVRMDDVGFSLIRRGRSFTGLVSSFLTTSGRVLVESLPYVIRGLGIIGTVAMLMVGGGMYTHNIERLHQLVRGFPFLLADLGVGLVLGAILLGLHHLITILQPGSR